MSNNKEDVQPSSGRSTTLEWKIDNFTRNNQYQSQLFEIDGYFCYMVASCCCGIDEKFWLFRLDVPGIKYESDGGFYPVYYTMSVVDRDGDDFTKVEGKLIGEIWEKTGILTTIYESYLEEYKLIETGSIELLFTFERREEAVEETQNLTLTECSSNVLRCSLQTETSEPQPTRDMCTNTEEEPSTLLETLSNDFCSFYENKTDIDCILRVGEVQFPVHRAVLSARSAVFSAMFHHDTTENRSGVVDIPDVEATALDDVIYYMYSGKIRGLAAETAAAMYTVADKYALIELRKECLDFLRCNLTLDNMCYAALLAHTHGEADLEERVLQFIEHRLEDIMKSNQWREFSTMKPLLANKLLGCAFVSCKKKLAEERTLK